jgi:uncharacterized short protein YbdD (DUF466 family)
MWLERGSGAAGRRGGMGGTVAALLSAIRRVAGMPDYAAYVEHLRRCHPEREAPTARQFYEEYVRGRYADGPTRCC